MISDTIAKVVEGLPVDRGESQAAMAAIMGGECTPAQIGAFLIALRIRGETVEQISGFAEAMREACVRIRTKHPNVVDTCGTGGDALDTFNISTAAALVTAAAGVPVAKHGNRSVSSKCGSADVLTELGVRIDLEPVEVEACLDEVGIGFLFAPSHHPAMKHAIGPRSSRARCSSLAQSTRWSCMAWTASMSCPPSAPPASQSCATASCASMT